MLAFANLHQILLIPKHVLASVHSILSRILTEALLIFQWDSQTRENLIVVRMAMAVVAVVVAAVAVAVVVVVVVAVVAAAVVVVVVKQAWQHHNDLEWVVVQDYNMCCEEVQEHRLATHTEYAVILFYNMHMAIIPSIYPQGT